MSRRATPEVVIRCQGRRIAQYAASGWTKFPRLGGAVALAQDARRRPVTTSRLWDDEVECWGCDSGPHRISEERLLHYFSEAQRLNCTKNVSVGDLM